LIFLPNLVWQWTHHFPVLHHMEQLARTQLVYVSPASFIIGQLLMLLPGIAVWIAGLWFYLVTGRGKPYRWLGWIYITVIVLLLVLHGKVYYSLGSYPMLLGAGAVYISHLTASGWPKWVRRPILVLFVIGLGIRMLPLLIPVYPPSVMAQYCKQFRFAGVTRWEDNTIHPLPQDYADMLGWKQIGMKTAQVYAGLDSATRSRTIIYGDNYGLSGAAAYYGRNSGLPPVQGKEASFLLWTPLNQHVDNVLLLTDDSTDATKPMLLENFREVRVMGRISDPYSREYGDLLLMCYGASPDFNVWFNARTRQMESIYR